MFSRRLAFIIPSLIIFLFGASSGILGPLLPTFARTFGVRVELTGILITLTFSGSLGSLLVSGFLADRFGKHRLLLITLGALGLSYLLFASAWSFLVLGIACVLAGMLGGTIEGLCSAIIADCDPNPARRNRNLVLLQLAFSAGAVAAIELAATLQARSDFWRITFFTMAAATLAIWGLSLFMRIPPAPAADPITLAIARRVAFDPAVLLLAAAIASYVGSEMSLANWISPILEMRHYPRDTAMMSALLFWLTMGIGRAIVGLSCTRISGFHLLCWLIAGGLASYILLLLPAGDWRLWAGAAAAGFTFSAIWPLLVSLASARYPSYSGTVVSVMVASGVIGGLVVPFLCGLVLKQSIFTSFLLMAAVFALLAVSIWWYGRRNVTDHGPASRLARDR